MELYKFCLFDSQDFEFFRTADFLGPRYFIMVAAPYRAAREELDAQDFATVVLERKTQEKKLPLTSQELTALATLLGQKLEAGSVCKALFDLRSQPSEWSYTHLQAIAVNTNPPEIVRARKVAENFLLLKRQERQLLAPSIPWSSANAPDHFESLSRKALRDYYDVEHAEIAPLVFEHDRKKKLLLHVCCGPDAAGVVEQLKDEFDLTCFWYDPNIQPKSEYDLRLDAFLKVAKIMNVEAVVGEYDAPHFLQRISGLEASPEQGAKCTICYDMRLERSAIEAKERNCDMFSTTLAISPHKVQQKLAALGQNLAKRHQISYLARNFMKHDGFKDSVDFTEAHDIYRQDYCGCWYSLYEGGPQARKMAEDLGLTEDNLKKGSYTLPHESH